MKKEQEIFGQYPGIEDNLEHILFKCGFFSPREIIDHSFVSKGWHQIAGRPSYWKESGATSREDFIECVRKEENERIKDLLTEVERNLAEKIAFLWVIPENELAEKLEKALNLNPGYIQGLNLDAEQLKQLLSPGGILALMEGLFDINDIQHGRLNAYHLKQLFSVRGIQALRSGFNINDIRDLELSSKHLKQLFSKEGRMALSEKWFPLADIDRLKLSPQALEGIFSENGIRLFKATWNQVANHLSCLDPERLEILFSKNAIKAMLEGGIEAAITWLSNDLSL